MIGDVPVKFGSIQNPYREFEIVVPAGGYTDPIRYNFDYFRMLQVNGPAVEIQFGSSGTPTTFIGAGIGYKIPFVIQELRFNNPNAQATTIRFALAIGDVSDDRINFPSGQAVPTSPLIPSLFTTAQIPVDDTTPALISAFDGTKKYVVVQANNVDLFIGDSTVDQTSGFKIAAGATFSFETTADVYAVCDTGTDDAIVMEGFA